MPGQTLAAALPVQVPATPGTYQVLLSATRAGRRGSENLSTGGCTQLQLLVEGAARSGSEGCCTPLLAEVQAALVDAHRRRQLPDSYLDVTQGWFASWKAWLKRKLLGNFKHAYVDVLSRQQSAFNQQILTALQELTECCALLDSTRTVDRSSLTARLRTLQDQMAEDQRQLRALQERVAHLERQSGNVSVGSSTEA
jgi:hypothetical protein